MTHNEPREPSTASPDHPALLNAILETAVDAIILIDEGGVIRRANRATERMFGYPVDQLIGRNVKMLMPLPDSDQHDQYLQRYHQTDEVRIIGSGREVEALRSDGSRFPIQLSVNEVVFGTRRWFAGIVHDISRVKEAQQQLRQSNQLLESRVAEATAKLDAAQAELVRKEKLALMGQIAGGIAHEIRNPLNAVRTSVYYLTHAKQAKPEKTAEHLQRIDRQVTVINNVVSALADVARLPEPNAEPMSLRECVTETLASIDPIEGLQVSISSEPDLPRVRGDRYQLPIVFRNLLRNARDAMPEGGEIQISLRRNVAEVGASVIDQGPGIPQQDVVKITEPFFSTKARGMGLGLAICKTILEKNGGRLEVTNNPGAGTTFTAWLPISEQDVR